MDDGRSSFLVEESDASPSRPARRRLRVAVTIFGLLALLFAGLWAARRPIAGRALDRELARAGVPARYKIETLEFGRQRLRNVVIGDPANPDLVADWIETGTRLSWSGATITSVHAGRIRLRGRLINGRVSLGVLDRLLPPPSGKPFTLPPLYLEVADARLRLETPAGLVGVKLSGRGQLNNGFRGRLAAVGPTLAAGNCAVRNATASMRLSIDRAAPTLAGPLRIGLIDCADASARAIRATTELTLTSALDGWRGSARLAAGTVLAEGARVAGLNGTSTFDGTARSTAGRTDLALAGFGMDGATAQRIALTGDYRLGDSLGFDGRISGGGVASRLARLDASGLAGTPLGLIAREVAAAVARATSSFDFEARLAADTLGGPTVRIARLQARAASGARLVFEGDDGLIYTRDGIRMDGQAIVDDGGLPGMRVSLDQAAASAPIRGLARIAPFSAGEASLSLTPVSFSAAPGGATRVQTSATISGPIGDGRVDGLTMPLTLLWNGGDRFALNPGCAPASFQRLAVAGLTLAPARLSLCPSGETLVRVDGGRVSGGARLSAPRIAGRLGATPLTLAASGGEVRLGDRGFMLRDVAARVGGEGRVTRIDVGRLDGRVVDGAVTGGFAGTGAQIANVPLLVSEAGGTWSLRGGVLTLAGATAVSDAEQRRFEPLRSDDVRFRLANNSIQVTGTLLQPATATRVAAVRIAHDLSRGAGEALLDVPGITFTEQLQPEALTRLTFGVVADVRGTVSGKGRIAWSGEGVTSTGAFRTDALDLAAAFGPVQGLKGTIRFDDLLALRSAPGQVASVAVINPGIPVTDGVIRYQTLPETRVQVEGGRWPFAGGTLALEPTLLDFSRPTPKRLTFRVTGMEAGQFLQQFDFDNLNATGVFDGVLPMVFDERGGHIVDGRLIVREGGGTLAYVGALTQKELGFWGDLAFQALKSIRYQNLNITMNGPLAGEMVTEVRFAGVSQGEGAKSNFLIRRLQRLPFVFNIRIKAPFRGLIDSARSFYSPELLIERNLPALLEEQNRQRSAGEPTPTPIQPPASRNMP